MDNNTKNFKRELFKICWHMRGGMTIDEVYCLAPEDRLILAGIVKENMETTKKSGLPYF